MKGKKKFLKYKKERVILSDVLPFEIPVTFSNRHFYNFLVSNKIELKSTLLTWDGTDPVLVEIIKLLFDLQSETITGNSFYFDKSKLKTIPFSFKISHKEDDFRELSIVHPLNLLSLVDFYDVNKQVILHYCGVSPFSIRKADQIAKFTIHKDNTHNKLLSISEELDEVEEDGKEYEHLKTYFVYKRYSNIHKFYESYKYHRCEKKYNKLYKFDISKCFDSIYTHSISWALLNKGIVKDNLKESTKSFGGKFDTLMQESNYGETNGILIGPEFSRIFAEIILQQIDKRVEVILRDQKILHKVDFEIFRYVDDFFVFYNEETTKEKVLKEFRLQLRDFKLSINDSKSLLYNKPIITEITIAKQKVSDLLNNCLVFKIDAKEKVDLPVAEHSDELEDGQSIIEDELEDLKSLKGKTGSIFIDSNKLITKFKTIIKESNITYKDILNYTLAVIEKKVTKLLKTYKAIDKVKNSERKLITALIEVLNFTFFIYSVSPKVNTTIKLCRILRRYTEFLNGSKGVNQDHKHLIYKTIYDNIFFILQKNKSQEHTQIETLYLLVAIGELGKEYWLNADMLSQYFCIQRSSEGKLFYRGDLTYFSITVLLFYMRNKKRYEELRVFIKDLIIKKFTNESVKTRGKNTELVLLFFDLLTCPYLDFNFKKKLLDLYGITDTSLQTKIIFKRKFWFTKWTGFEFGKELDAKISQEVY